MITIASIRPLIEKLLGQASTIMELKRKLDILQAEKEALTDQYKIDVGELEKRIKMTTLHLSERTIELNRLEGTIARLQGRLKEKSDSHNGFTYDELYKKWRDAIEEIAKLKGTDASSKEGLYWVKERDRLYSEISELRGLIAKDERYWEKERERLYSEIGELRSRIRNIKNNEKIRKLLEL